MSNTTSRRSERAVKTVLMLGGILLIYGLAEYAADSLFDRMALPLSAAPTSIRGN